MPLPTTRTLLSRPHTHLSPPVQEFLRTFWVLAIMAGIVGIIVAAKGRIHAPEPLQGVHACNGVIPYVMPLGNSSV